MAVVDLWHTTMTVAVEKRNSFLFDDAGGSRFWIANPPSGRTVRNHPRFYAAHYGLYCDNWGHQHSFQGYPIRTTWKTLGGSRIDEAASPSLVRLFTDLLGMCRPVCSINRKPTSLVPTSNRYATTARWGTSNDRMVVVKTTISMLHHHGSKGGVDVVLRPHHPRQERKIGVACWSAQVLISYFMFLLSIPSLCLFQLCS